MSLVDADMDKHFGRVIGAPERRGEIGAVRRDGLVAHGITTWSTFGLSRHSLTHPVLGPICHELVVACNTQHDCQEICDTVQMIGDVSALSGTALSYGELLTLPFPIPASNATFGLIYSPSMWPRSVNPVKGTKPPAYIAWMILLSESERLRYLKDGLAALEDDWTSGNIDVLDITRA